MKRTGCRVFMGAILLVASFFATKCFANHSASHVIDEVYANHFETEKSVTHMKGEHHYSFFGKKEEHEGPHHHALPPSENEEDPERQMPALESAPLESKHDHKKEHENKDHKNKHHESRGI
jgi:hypothetical protein